MKIILNTCILSDFGKVNTKENILNNPRIYELKIDETVGNTFILLFTSAEDFEESRNGIIIANVNFNKKITEIKKIKKKVNQFLTKHQIKVLRFYDPFLIPLLIKNSSSYLIIMEPMGNLFYLSKFFKTSLFPQLLKKSGLNCLNKIDFGFHLDKALIKKNFKKADLVVAGNKNNLESDLYLGSNLYNTRLMRINVNPNLYTISKDKREHIRKDRIKVAFIGRLQKDKMFKDYLRLHERLISEEQFEWHVVGEGEMKSALKNFNNIIYHGKLSQKELFELHKEFDFVFIPGGGLVMIECFANGTNVIAYEFEWHSEIVINEFSGHLIPYKDIDKAAKVLFKYHNMSSSEFEEKMNKISKMQKEIFNAVFKQGESQRIISDLIKEFYEKKFGTA